ncbi:MAG: RES family NAD+ phosphorylase [Gammaproteobacteria bacterium]|jgi:hypothetical protein
MIGEEQFVVSSDAKGDWHRNIVSLREPVDLFDALADDEAGRQVLLEHEMATKPYAEPAPALTRPFEQAEMITRVADAIDWPYAHPNVSRFSDGRFGVWYGAGTLETSIRETAFHFWQDETGNLDLPESTREIHRGRQVFLVECTAALVDLRPLVGNYPDLLHPDDYGFCQALGRQVRDDHLPGLINPSVRDPRGLVAAVFDPRALTRVRQLCYLDYFLNVRNQRVRVQRRPGRNDLTLAFED